MRFKSGLRLATICAMAFALPVFAHHSHGNYVDTFMDIEGVVKELHLVVPHSWIYLEVKAPNGELQVGIGSNEPHGPPENWSHARLRQTGRHRQSAVSSSQGRLQRVSSGVSESQGWNRQRLGRQ